MAPVHNVFDGTRIRSGRKREKTGSNRVKQEKYRRENPFPTSDYTSRFASLVDFFPSMRSLVPGYHLGIKKEKSKHYCKPDSEQRVLFFHNKISGGHTSLLQVYKCYSGNKIVHRQCQKERFKIYKATKFENCTFQTTSQSGEILPRFVFSRQTCEVIYYQQNAIQPPLFQFSKPGLSATRGL